MMASILKNYTATAISVAVPELLSARIDFIISLPEKKNFVDVVDFSNPNYCVNTFKLCGCIIASKLIRGRGKRVAQAHY